MILTFQHDVTLPLPLHASMSGKTIVVITLFLAVAALNLQRRNRYVKGPAVFVRLRRYSS